MIEKNKILESWIMVEHLSEGDIDDRKKDILLIKNLQENDYYRLFQNIISENKICKGKGSGIAVYFDVFDFNDVLSILREQYNLQKTNEEIRVGNKFSFALYFDKGLNYQKDLTFFTESGFIRYYKKVPHENDFRNFEDEFKKRLEQDFDEAAKDIDKFNSAILGLMNEYNISVKNCRVQPVANIENSVTNLHSFFIGDLEAAKDIDTFNLNEYLYGNADGRINLDSKSDSQNFNPDVFEDILLPCNYPLGRFPGNPKFALSLMQQVAVNLATGYDDKTIRSVNGPPGTGKTTLLKDIFAQLIVEQAFDIVSGGNREIKGTEATVYFNTASIGVLPDIISEKGIVVASSNNGAVQNIVNELPLIEGQIDDEFIDELKSADYFMSIANSDVSSEWEETDGKKHEVISVTPNDGEDKFWGLFSLEGGKKVNMEKIIANMKAVVKYFDEEYVPDDNVYSDFKKLYNEVMALRGQRQKLADGIKEYNAIQLEIDRRKNNYKADYENKSRVHSQQCKEAEAALIECENELSQVENQLRENEGRKEGIAELKRNADQYAQLIREQKPGFLASRAEKEAHKVKMDEAAQQLKSILENSLECDKKAAFLKKQFSELQNKKSSCLKKKENIEGEFEKWNSAEKGKIIQLIQRAQEFENLFRGGAEPLDMTKPYDDLQQSNPWFDKDYRIAQSRLFIKALAVRKQFLYENRKNVKAAAVIWKNQNKYLEKKQVIEAAWGWINMTIPVISSTFASFSRMCTNLGVNTLGHLFVDEAGQAIPQASVGAVFRSRHVMVVGDPSQIKPVLTLDSSVLAMLGRHFGVTEKYLSDSASTQTLVDAASDYGFYREQDKSDDFWIGIPLWVHRRCQYPMFTISNIISYNGFMVQGNPGDGKTGWFDVKGRANNKYVEAQGEFLLKKIRQMAEENPDILDKTKKDVVYVISPFSNVAFQLSQKLRKIGFTRYDKGKPTNVGTIHTFQGKEAPIVFMVLGADNQSSGAARWALSEPNMMNVAATRAKKEFYVIGDKELYLGIGCDVASDTYKIINRYKKEHPELVDDDVNSVIGTLPEDNGIEEACYDAPAEEADFYAPVSEDDYDTTVEEENDSVVEEEAVIPAAEVSVPRIRGKITYVGSGKRARYAYVKTDDGKEYAVTEDIVLETENADRIIQKDMYITFVPVAGNKKDRATDVKAD